MATLESRIAALERAGTPRLSDDAAIVRRKIRQQATWYTRHPLTVACVDALHKHVGLGQATADLLRRMRAGELTAADQRTIDLIGGTEFGTLHETLERFYGPKIERGTY